MEARAKIETDGTWDKKRTDEIVNSFENSLKA